MIKFILLLVITIGQSFAHGYITDPIARQVKCQNDGGIWQSQDGSSIPNEACRNAFIESGVYPFTQKNEFATLVPSYNNIDVVKAAVKDGLLCSGGSDEQKKGFDIPSPEWHKTKVNPGETIPVTLYGTAPHEPSFNEYYITKNGFDSATDVLTWDDLILLKKTDVIFDENANYTTMITIPNNISGNAILFTRWQRIDSAGEGFYNCSDLKIEGAITNNDNTNSPAAKARAIPSTLEGAGEVVLSASASDPGNGENLNYKWEQISGPTTYIKDSYGEYAKISLPKVDQDTSYTFLITVSNGQGSDSTEVIVTQKASEKQQNNNDTDTTTDIPPSNDDADYTYPAGLGNYVKGDIVYNDGGLYICNIPNWCNNSTGGVYTPGSGWAWTSAWEKYTPEEKTPVNPADMTWYKGANTYYSVNNGDIQCLSFDGKNCIWIPEKNKTLIIRDNKTLRALENNPEKIKEYFKSYDTIHLATTNGNWTRNIVLPNIDSVDGKTLKVGVFSDWYVNVHMTKETGKEIVPIYIHRTYSFFRNNGSWSHLKEEANFNLDDIASGKLKDRIKPASCNNSNWCKDLK